MPLFSLDGVSPQVHPDAFIAPTASIVGDVVIEAGASVWYGAVVRGDYSRITIRAGANVQDGSVLHATADLPLEVGPNATIGHVCVVHGATIGAQALIANGSTILDGATIGAGSLVAAGSLVLPGTDVPPGMMAAGSPAQVKRSLEGTAAAQWIEITAPAYAELAQRHRLHVREVVEDAAAVS